LNLKLIYSRRLHLISITRDQQPITININKTYDTGSIEEYFGLIVDCFNGLTQTTISTPKLSPRDRHARFESLSTTSEPKRRTFSFASSEEGV
jgi:hypothetical protein